MQLLNYDYEAVTVTHGNFFHSQFPSTMLINRAFLRVRKKRTDPLSFHIQLYEYIATYTWKKPHDFPKQNKVRTYAQELHKACTSIDIAVLLCYPSSD